MLKTPPHNLDAEISILGSVLLNPKSDISSLGVDDFYKEAHGLIFQAMKDCKTDGDSIDVITVSNRLTKTGNLEKAGGVNYLADLINAVGISVGIKSYIKIVKELAQLRKTISLCSDIAEKAFNLTSPDSLISEITTKARDIQFSDKHYVDGVDISNVYDSGRMLEEYKSYIKGLKHNRFITGISEIDKRIRGIAGGEVLTILARSGSFKTAMLQNLLKGYIDHSQWGSAMFSIEMPVAGIAERYNEIVHGASGRDIEEIYQNSDALEIRSSLEIKFKASLKNLFIIPSKVSAKDIIQYVSLIESHYKIKIGVIGIDYLGLMDGPGKSQYEIISNIAKDTKLLAKRLDIPVILLAQVSRGQGGSGTQELSLESGRDSGAIEESADFILGLWQQEKEGNGEDKEYDLICKILKNRKGSKNSCWKLNIDESNLRLGYDAERYEPPKPKKISY